MTDALGRDTTLAYDTMNRVTSATGGGGTSTTSYDALGQVSTQTDPDGRVTTYYYDFKGQLTRQTDGIGNYVQYTYDAEGQVSTVTDGLNQTTINLYDSAGRLTKTTGADGKSKVYAYDSAGRVTSEYATAGGSPADQRDYYYHGTTGQLTKVTYDGTYSANLYYDATNRLTKLTDWIDATNGLRYAYDSAGRAVTLTDYDNRTLVYGYDANGRATTMTDWHGNSTAYTYTALGQVSTVTAPGSKVWDYDYNALGQPTKVTCPNTMTTEYAYDGTNRMTKIAYMDGATTVDSFTYGLTPASQITKITHNDGSYWDYGNDARGRLTTAVRKDSGNNTQTSHAYVYDAGDNMLSKTVDGTLTTFMYTSGNELTMQTTGGTSTSMYYDVAGRMISKAQGAYSATYDWRYDAKLYAVTSNFPGEGTVNFQYRGDKKRHSRSAGGTTTRYNYDAAWNEVSEGDANNNLQITFTMNNPGTELGGKLAEIDGTNPTMGLVKYYFKDHLGSTRRIHGESKQTLGTTEYAPYGNDYTSAGIQPTFRFTGKAWDTGISMYHFAHRYYDTSYARWSSADPAGGVDGPNRFAYVCNSPHQAYDLLGLWNETDHGNYAFFDKIADPRWHLIQHFRPKAKVLRLLVEAVDTCNPLWFGGLMHQWQDTFSHYDQGYRSPVGHALESLIYSWLGTRWSVFLPDSTEFGSIYTTAFEQMKRTTGVIEQYWDRLCGGGVPQFAYRWVDPKVFGTYVESAGWIVSWTWRGETHERKFNWLGY